MTTLDEREQRTLSKRCTQGGEVKALEEYPPKKGARDGRNSQCLVCRAKRGRERRWAQKGIPESEWPRLHREADRKAEARAAARDRAQDRHKVCCHCDKVKSLEEFPPDKRHRDGKYPSCHACNAERRREASWRKRGIPESDWPRLHRELDRQRRMRELAAQYGLK